MPERRGPPPREELDAVHRALYEHGPDTRASVLAKAMGRQNRGATGRTLRHLADLGRIERRQVLIPGQPLTNLYTASTWEPPSLPAESVIRLALDCFKRGILSATGGRTKPRSAAAELRWRASAERAELVELFGGKLVDGVEERHAPWGVP